MSPGSRPSSTTIWFTDAFPNLTGTRSATRSPGFARNTVVDELLGTGKLEGAVVRNVVTGEAEVRDEIAGSIARIESELGRPCRHFSYPYGDAGSAGPPRASLGVSRDDNADLAPAIAVG